MNRKVVRRNHRRIWNKVVVVRALVAVVYAQFWPTTPFSDTKKIQTGNLAVLAKTYQAPKLNQQLQGLPIC
jgi:hypothetical protein